MDAKSGVSGAGKKCSDSTHYVSINENIFAYKPFEHRHQPEITEKLKKYSGKDFDINFVPHLIPATRGELIDSYMLLKEEHIVTSRINWKRKSENLLDMAEELNLGINSFVFIDDSVVECSEVMTEIPEIFTLRIPNEKSIPLILQNFWGCDKLKITEEDKNRTKMYIAEKKRKTTSSKLSETEFLEKLGIVIDIHSVKPSEIERASQLTLRTNQFNMSTIRRQIPEIKELIQADSHFVYVLKVKDNFGDYGVVGLLILENRGNYLFLDTFLLSCRVLGRKVEDTILFFIKRKLEELGYEYFEAKFIKSDRNTPFKDFILRTNWPLIETNEKGEEIYRVYDISVLQILFYLIDSHDGTVLFAFCRACTKMGDGNDPLFAQKFIFREISYICGDFSVFDSF
jgi:FkbH-like protein